MTTYYVAKNGNDGWPGTEAQPWLTIQQAADTMVAGDETYIKRGTYVEQVQPVNSGSAGNIIRYEGYPGHAATVDGGALGCFRFASDSYIEINNLELLGAVTHGVSGTDASYIWVRNCVIHDNDVMGINFANGSHHIYIWDNVVYNSGQNPAEDGHGIIIYEGGDYIEILRNIVYNNGQANFASGIEAGAGSHVIISDNIIYENYDIGIDFSGVSDWTIERNIIYGNGGNGILVHNIDGLRIGQNLIFDNLVGAAWGAGIWLGAGGSTSVNVEIYNNTIYGHTTVGGATAGITMDFSAATINNITLRNNITYNNKRDLWIQDDDSIALSDYNDWGDDDIHYDGVNYNLAGYQVASGEDAHAITADPLFVDAAVDCFNLQVGSPCRDHGTDVGYSYEGLAPDMGALEYSAPPPVLVATARVPCNTALGNQDIQTWDLDGEMPSAALFIATCAVSDAVLTDHAVLSYGAATATDEQWVVAQWAEHDQDPTDTGRRGATDECVMIIDPSTHNVDGEAAFVQFIANGVRINWGNAPASAYLLTVVLFTGADLSVMADVHTFDKDQNDTIDVNTVGFEPDAVLTAYYDSSFTDADDAFVLNSYGLVLNKDPIEQYAIGTRSADNNANSWVYSHITDNYGIIHLAAAGTVEVAAEYSTFDPNGFSCTTRLGNLGADSQIGYLALAFGNEIDFEGAIIDSPIANGNASWTDPGFRPQFVMIGLTQCTALDTATGGGSIGFSTFDADDEYCNSVQDEHNQGTSDTQSVSDNQAVTFPDDDGTDAHIATFVSFDDLGWTLFWTATEGTAVKWWYLALQVSPETIEGIPVEEVEEEEVPIVVPVFTTPSLHQMTGLSLSVFKPTIDTSASPVSYIANGELVEELRDQIGSLRFSIAAMGGYDKANFAITDRQSKIERWLEEGLGRHIEIYNPALEEIWSGVVNKVAVNLGVLSATRGPLLDVPNRVSLIYSTMDTSTNPPVLGERTKTAAVNDTDAQTKYAIIEKVLSAGGVTAVNATQIRDTYLAENAWPMTSQRTSERGREPSVMVECVGYYHWLKVYVYNQTVNTGTQNLSAKLQAVIDAQLNTIIRSYDVITNTLAVNQYENDDKTALSLIKELVAMGDANDARYLFGVYAKRRARYEAAPTTEIAYQQRVGDPDLRIETLIGDEVESWDVLPGRWLFFPDFLVGTAQPVQRRLDSRFMFIESTRFTAPDGISLVGGKVDEISQKLARLGLGGVGG